MRNIYWNVISKTDNSKDNNERTRTRHTRSQRVNLTIRIPDSPIEEPPPQVATIPEQPVLERATTPGSQAPWEDMEARASVDHSTAEDWATPATQQEPTQPQPIVNPPISTTEQSPILSNETTRTLPVSPQLNLYPLDEINEEFNTQDADTWLANLEFTETYNWLQGTVETASSPPTSLVTDTRTAMGSIYKACKCPATKKRIAIGQPKTPSSKSPSV